MESKRLFIGQCKAWAAPEGARFAAVSVAGRSDGKKSGHSLAGNATRPGTMCFRASWRWEQDLGVQRVLIHFRSGAKSGQTEIFPIARYQSLYIGRDGGCDVRFDLERDAVVSRNHAVIEWTRGDKPEFSVSDLLSTNGTFLNGKRIKAATRLNSGDQLQFGKRGPQIEVVLDEVAAPAGLNKAADPRTQQISIVEGPATLHQGRRNTGNF